MNSSAPTRPALSDRPSLPDLPAINTLPDRLALPSLLTPLPVYHYTIFTILPFSVLTPLPVIDQRPNQTI